MYGGWVSKNDFFFFGLGGDFSGHSFFSLHPAVFPPPMIGLKFVHRAQVADYSSSRPRVAGHVNMNRAHNSRE